MSTSIPAPKHKTSFGRTSLFLTGDDSVLQRSIRTVSGAARRKDGTVYHDLSTTARHALRTQGSISCWHCCEVIQNESIPIPKAYDATQGVFHVYGHFDCLECAKAYIIDQTGFDRGGQMGVFFHMAKSVYKHTSDIVEAPPRVALKRFGGAFDPPSLATRRNVVRVVDPPFVSYCMLLEERTAECSISSGINLNDVDTTMPPALDDAVDFEEFTEPPPRARYDDFVASAATTSSHKKSVAFEDEEDDDDDDDEEEEPASRKRADDVASASSSRPTRRASKRAPPSLPAKDTLQRFFRNAPPSS